MKLVIAQINLLVGDIAKNVEQVIATASQARDEKDADLVVFPELTLTGYPPEDLLLRPGLQTAVQLGLDRLCATLSGIAVIVGFPREENGERFNSAGLIRNGVIEAVYDKKHLPNYAVFDEKRYFQPGDGKATVVEIAGIKLGITVCEDIWFSGPAMACKQAGAQVLVNLNASPFHIGKAQQRQGEVQARVKETGLPLVYANLVGGQDELVFDGASFVMNAAGEYTFKAPAFEVGLYAQEFVLNAQQAMPLPGDIAADPLELEAIYKALVLAVRDYVTKNGFTGAVLGLSGGIDSALTLAIAADALGGKNIHAVLMPSRYTADMSNQDAQLQADIMGVSYDSIPIETPFKAFLDILAPVFGDTETDTTEENIQARCRGVILMAISNKQGRMLLTTGNKSEMSVGYATLYGDMAGGYAPIKDCPKLLVYALSRYRNTISQVIPERVITRPPSAELRPDQVDQDSLPPYEVLDAILERYIEADQSITDIIQAGFDDETVRRVTRLVDFNEYKRRQAPPGVRITQRAFGRDRRYPISSGYSHADPTKGRH